MDYQKTFRWRTTIRFDIHYFLLCWCSLAVGNAENKNCNRTPSRSPKLFFVTVQVPTPKHVRSVVKTNGCRAGLLRASERLNCFSDRDRPQKQTTVDMRFSNKCFSVVACFLLLERVLNREHCSSEGKWKNSYACVVIVWYF